MSGGLKEGGRSKLTKTRGRNKTDSPGKCGGCKARAGKCGSKARVGKCGCRSRAGKCGCRARAVKGIGCCSADSDQREGGRRQPWHKCKVRKKDQEKRLNFGRHHMICL